MWLQQDSQQIQVWRPPCSLAVLIYCLLVIYSMCVTWVASTALLSVTHLQLWTKTQAALFSPCSDRLLKHLHALLKSIFVCATPCRQEVTSQQSHALDDIPDGTSLHPPGALPCTHDDEVAMRHFLDCFRGRGVVCTSMDKAEDKATLMFMCPKLYVDNLMTDLETGATYQPATLSHADLLHVGMYIMDFVGIMASQLT